MKTSRIPLYASHIPVGGSATIDGVVMGVRDAGAPGVLLIDVDVFEGPTRVLALGLRETFMPSADLRTQANAMLGDSWTITVVRPNEGDLATGAVHDGMMVVSEVERRRCMLLAA